MSTFDYKCSRRLLVSLTKSPTSNMWKLIISVLGVFRWSMPFLVLQTYLIRHINSEVWTLYFVKIVLTVSYNPVKKKSQT